MLWITGHVKRGTKTWGSVHILTSTLAASEGVRTPGPAQDRHHCERIGMTHNNVSAGSTSVVTEKVFHRANEDVAHSGYGNK